MTIDRRDFLKLASICGLGVISPFGFAPSAKAQDISYDGLFFINVNAGGGWDPTSFCDPKGFITEDDPDAMNRSYARDDIRTAGNINYAPVGYNETFFEKYYQDLLVVNGMNGATNSHDAGSRHTFSGKLLDGNPAFGALVAAAKLREAPMAFLSSGGYDVTMGLVAPTRSGNIGALERIAYPDRINPADPESRYHTVAAQGRIKLAQRARLQAQMERRQLPRVKAAMNTLYTARLGESELRRLTDFLPEQLDNSGNPIIRQAQFALAAYKAGLSVSANLSMGGFDTHGNHDANHIPRLATLFQGVDFLLEEAERLGVRDRIVVYMGSDFSRTPGYNDGMGKDHWSVNSAMLIGAGIPGNRVIGGTDERHNMLKVDPDNGFAISDSGIHLEPGHIHHELRKIAGIEEGDLAAEFRLDAPDINLFG